MSANRLVLGGVMLMSISTTVCSAQQAAAKPTVASAAPSIVIRDAWSRPALKGGTGVLYMVIENNGAAAVNLASATSSAAKAVEMHQSMQQGSNTMMHPMTDIAIAARTKYALIPGDVHVMLIGLQKQLVVGDTVPFTLVFRGGATVKSTAIVRKP